MKDTALLVIDMQNGFLNERSPLYIDGAAATVPACAEMIAFCREQNVPVFFVMRVYASMPPTEVMWSIPGMRPGQRAANRSRRAARRRSPPTCRRPSARINGTTTS